MAGALESNVDDSAVTKKINELQPRLLKVLKSALEKSKPELAAELATILDKKPNDTKTVKTLDSLLEELKTGLQLSLNTTPETTGFVGREGTVYSFPGVNTDSNSKIDHNQIGADAVRIFLEALRDTFAPLPVLQTSTAALWNSKHCPSKDKDKEKNSCKGLSFKSKDDIQDVLWQLTPEYVNGFYNTTSQSDTLSFQVSAKEFEDIEAKARDAESATATAVGKLIRGSGNMGANEALAKVGETAAGVLARHIVERFGWCNLYSSKKFSDDEQSKKTKLRGYLNGYQS
jgi:hypothetical protein